MPTFIVTAKEEARVQYALQHDGETLTEAEAQAALERGDFKMLTDEHEGVEIVEIRMEA